jgi:hypothetical protein
LINWSPVSPVFHRTNQESAMNAGRNIGIMGIAIGLSTAIAIGMVTGSESLRASARQDAQPQASLRPVVYQSLQHDLSPRLDSMQPIEPVAYDPNRVRINKLLPSRKKMATQLPQIWQDPVAQLAHGLAPMPSPIANFDGQYNYYGYYPPDTQGAVGPNHYVQWVNVTFAIYDKSGTKVYPPAGNPTPFAAGNTIWTGFGGACQTSNDGDPITLYDRQAGRWLMAQFALPNYPSGPFYQCLAISQTGDPTGSWYRYAWVSPTVKMNDYPHFGVWPDGYYMTINQFTAVTGNWGGAGVVAFERARMLAGLSAQAVYFDLLGVDVNLGGMLPSDLDGPTAPPAGSPNYVLQFDDNAWGYPADQLELWKFHVDWTTPANSTFTGPAIINLTALGLGFDANMCGGSRNCIPQPVTAVRLDAISDRLMYRLAYRNFGTHESLVLNHTVDANSLDHAGIRWYEVRSPGTTPTVYQAGTYAPDTDHRWMGSIAMDANGDIALGYSVSSTATYPSVRYVGRLAGDPLGTLPQSEVTLMAGTGYQTGTAYRWGDYSMMAIDPSDDCTFWYTQEYIQTNGGAPWRTRIGSFKFPSCGAAPGPVVTLDPASVTVKDDTFATFTAAASGAPTPTVQWQVSTNSGVTWTNLARGGTAATLTLPAFMAANGYRYRAVFTNTLGSATSNAAILSVVSPPTVTLHPAAQTVASGLLASFSSTATGQPAPTRRWQSRVGAGPWTDIGGATASPYTFTVGDNGTQYRAVFTNSVDEAVSLPATLTVASGLTAPVVTLHPASVSAPAESFTSFAAAATGNPTPTVQWQVSTNGGSTWTSLIHGGTGLSLMVPAVTEANGRMYRAVFTNSQGSATTNAATLTVTPIVAPVVARPAVVRDTPGASSTPSAVAPSAAPVVTRPAVVRDMAGASPAPSAAPVAGVPLPPTGSTPPTAAPSTRSATGAASRPDPTGQVTVERRAQATTSPATGVISGSEDSKVRAASAADVNARSNEAGLAGGCLGAPGVPANLRIKSNAEGKVTFVWDAPSGSPTTYLLEAETTLEPRTLPVRDLRSAATTFTASDMAAGSYSARVRAMNACGTSGVSNQVVFILQ